MKRTNNMKFTILIATLLLMMIASLSSCSSTQSLASTESDVEECHYGHSKAYTVHNLNR